MSAAIYDWDGWFSRRRFVLRAGRDYRCSTTTMAQQVRNTASERGLRVTVRESPGDRGLVVDVRGSAERPLRGPVGE